MADEERRTDIHSVNPDGTKTNQWIMDELLGDDDLDDGWNDLDDLADDDDDEAAPKALSYREKLAVLALGGPGSGHHGHESVEGQLGGSAPGTGGVQKKFAALVEAIAQPDGGFTAHAVTGEQPTKGFVVSILQGVGHRHAHQTVVPVKDLTVEKLVEFALDNKDVLTQPQNFFGAWHNPKDGNVYLDISRVVDTAEEANQLGNANKQIAYFDLERGVSVETTTEKEKEQT